MHSLIFSAHNRTTTHMAYYEPPKSHCSVIDVIKVLHFNITFNYVESDLCKKKYPITYKDYNRIRKKQYKRVERICYKELLARTGGTLICGTGEQIVSDDKKLETDYLILRYVMLRRLRPNSRTQVPTFEEYKDLRSEGVCDYVIIVALMDANIKAGYHHFRAPLTVYPPELHQSSNNDLRRWEDENEGKKDLFQDEANHCEMRKENKLGMSLFSAVDIAGFPTPDAWRFAHARMLGKDAIVFRQRQAVINAIDDPAQSAPLQCQLNQDIAVRCGCFVHLDPSEVGFSGLHNDRQIRDGAIEFVRHLYLYPLHTGIPVSDFKERALCHLPAMWTICPYSFNATADVIDLPDVPAGVVDAACMLLECHLGNRAVPDEEKLLVGFLEYYIAYNWKRFEKDIPALVSLGQGVLADLLLRAGAMIEARGTRPYPTCELDDLVRLCRDYE